MKKCGWSNSGRSHKLVSARRIFERGGRTKHRSNEAQRSAFVLCSRAKKILSEAGSATSSFLLRFFSRREKMNSRSEKTEIEN